MIDRVSNTKDRLDEALEKKTQQDDLVPEISNDEELEQEIEEVIGNLEDLKSPVGSKDWVSASDIADDIEESLGRINNYIAEKAE